MHFLRQTADVVMAFDDVRRVAADRNALDHVRVERALREKMIPAMAARTVRGVFRQQLFGRMLKDIDEFASDDFSFLFRIGDALQRFQM
jgi:hypothetical protein